MKRGCKIKKSLSVLCAALLVTLLIACRTTDNTPTSEPISTTTPVEENIPKEKETTEATPISAVPEFDLENKTVTINS